MIYSGAPDCDMNCEGCVWEEPDGSCEFGRRGPRDDKCRLVMRGNQGYCSKCDKKLTKYKGQWWHNPPNKRGLRLVK